MNFSVRHYVIFTEYVKVTREDEVTPKGSHVTLRKSVKG
jgi:hypothetical protein